MNSNSVLNNNNKLNKSENLNTEENKSENKKAEKININKVDTEREQTINNKISEDLNKNESELSAYRRKRIKRTIDKEIA